MTELSIRELQDCADVADRLGDADLVALIRVKIAALSVPAQALIDESMPVVEAPAAEGSDHG